MGAFLRPLVLAALAALVALAAPAAAHGNQIGGEPAPFTAVDAPPERVVVLMSEAIEADLSHVRVLDAAGGDHAVGKPYWADGNHSRLAVDVALPGNGTYTVSWGARWRSDGHDTHGSYGFAVGDARLPAGLDVGTTSPAGPGAQEIAVRALIFAGALLAPGALLFLLVVDRDPRSPRGAARALRASLVGAALLAAGTAVLLLQQSAAYGSGSALADAARLARQTPLGRVLALRLALALALAAALGWAMRDEARKTPPLAAAALSLLALPTLGLAGHAARDGAAGVLVDTVHLAGGAVWVGGLPLLVLGLLAFRRARTRGAERLAERYGRGAMLASAAVLLTGALEGLARLDGDVGALTTTPYGRILLAKILLVGGLLAFGGWNHFVLIPRLKRTPEDDALPLAATSRVETVLAAIVLVVAGALTATAPGAPAEPYAPPPAQAYEGDGLDVHAVLTLDPHRIGLNTFTVELTILSNGTALEYARSVQLFLNHEDPSVGTSTITLEHAGSGTYAGRGSLGLPGTWSVTVFVQRPDAYDDAVTFDVRV